MKENIIKPVHFLYLLIVSLFLAFFVNTGVRSLLRWDYLVLLCTVILLLYVFRKSIRWNWATWCLLGGGLLKVIYILYTQYFDRQHDVVDFVQGMEGHAYYILYIFQNHRLPDFDPRTVWSFSHPPLHHIISAIWLWVNAKLGYWGETAFENQQILPMCYMILTALFVYYTAQKLSFEKWGMRIALTLVCFHPIYVMLAGSINNDALSLMLSVAAIYFAVCWYEDNSFLALLLVAATIGLSMMAKLSGGLVAVGIGALMVYKLIERIRKKDKVIRTFVEYICFAIIVFPLGLWWPIRNLVKFNVPISYCEQAAETVGKTDLTSRFFDFTLTSVYPLTTRNGDAYHEYNLLWMMLKTSLFGEYNYSLYSERITAPAVVLFVVATVLAIVAFAASIYMIFSKKSKMDIGYRLLFAGIYVAVLFGFVSFALQNPYFCAGDFRYSAVAIIVEALLLGMFADRIKDEKMGRIFAVSVTALSVLFALSSACVYVMIGFFQNTY